MVGSVRNAPCPPITRIPPTPQVSYVHCDPRSCACGELCSNRPFHLLKSPLLQTFLTENRCGQILAVEVWTVTCGQLLLACLGTVLPSWPPHLMYVTVHTCRGHGVKAMQYIRRGQFVIEYSGEVLDSAELDFRMSEARRTGEQHFYIMELDPGVRGVGRVGDHSGKEGRPFLSSEGLGAVRTS